VDWIFIVRVYSLLKETIKEDSYFKGW